MIPRLNILLAPFAAVYAAYAACRNLLYDWGLLPSGKADVPTICVGNLAVGGTGKTPHVEYLLRLLSPRYEVAFLSRGYKRHTHGFVLADSAATAGTIGDEPMQIHTKFPHIPVAVCEDRLKGVRALMRSYPTLKVIVLDDAYQHRRIRCGLNMLLTAYDRLYCDDWFLPMGRLRDNRWRSRQAQVVVVTKCPENMTAEQQRHVTERLHLSPQQALFFSTIQYPDQELPADAKVLLLTGIAHPEYLLQHLQRTWKKIDLIAFADHHGFSAEELKSIAYRAADYSVVFTTEKDYARLNTVDLPAVLREKLRPVPIRIQMHGQAGFDRLINDYVNDNQ